MPLFTHLFSLKLDLSQNVVDNNKLRDFLTKLYGSVEVLDDAREWKDSLWKLSQRDNITSSELLEIPYDFNQYVVDNNKSRDFLTKLYEPLEVLDDAREWKDSLWKLIQRDNITSSELLEIAYDFNQFDEQSWVLLHLACASCGEVDTFLDKIKTQSVSDQENALQRQLFLMSQPGFDFSVNQDLAQSILTSEDNWALFSLLSHPTFSFESSGRELLRNRLINTFTLIPVDYKESGADKNAALIWIFIKSSGITNDVGSVTLFKNIIELDVLTELVGSKSEDLTAIIKLSNRVSILTSGAKNFLGAVWSNLVTRWDLDTYEQAREFRTKSYDNATLAKKRSKYKTDNAQEIINQFVFMIQRSMLDNILNEYNKDIVAKKVNEALNFPVVTFFLRAFCAAFWDSANHFQRQCVTQSVDWLVNLEVFKTLKFLKLSFSEKQNFLQAIFTVKDNYFIQKLFFLEEMPKLSDSTVSWSDRLEFKQIQQLEYIFSQDRTVNDLHNIEIKIHHPEVFMYTLKNHFAPALNQAINQEDVAEKDVSYKCIRRTADLVKLLPPNLQSELYKDDQYVLFRAYNRVKKYERQLDKWEARGLGRDLKKETKMKVLNWLIYNFPMIKERRFDPEDPPMKDIYNLYGPDLGWVTDMSRVDAWFRNVILQNSPRAQGLIHGLGLFGTVEGGVKGSKMAETLTLFSDEFIKNFISGTNITLLDIWNAAYPARKCFTDKDRLSRRDAALAVVMRQDIDDDNSSVGDFPEARANTITTVVGLSQSQDNTEKRESVDSNRSTFSNQISSRHIFPLFDDINNAGLVSARSFNKKDSHSLITNEG